MAIELIFDELAFITFSMNLVNMYIPLSINTLDAFPCFFISPAQLKIV